MIIIHNYYPTYTKKLIELGMAQKGDGFKITHCFATKPEMLFNTVAQRDGELYGIVRDYGSCFYIDRLQGGSYFFDYPFSKELMHMYDELTGGNFLGLQLHELAETRTYDWNRIKTQLKEQNLSWNEENIYEAVKKVSCNKEYPHFSQGNAGEYASLTPPETVIDWYDDIEWVVKTRMDKWDGKIVNCDSCRLYARIEQDNNVALSFIEIGGLTPRMRLQYALRRGMSRARGKKWGVYLEPWNDTDVTAYCFMKDNLNEWNITKDDFVYFTAGPNGGTSMSLARRMMYCSLFAGSHYFSEEWGQANTFYDWESFELSPYGKIKKDFFEFSRAFENVKATIPCAFVLPKEYKIFPIHHELTYTNNVTEGDYFEFSNRMNKLFSNDSTLGYEDKYLTCGKYGSVFDIIYDDSYETPEDEYDVLIDFSGKFVDKSDKAVDGFDNSAVNQKLDDFFKDYLPFENSSNGDIDYMLFENDGKKYCCFLNHNGITKDVENGERVNPDAELALNISFKDADVMEVLNICECKYCVNENSIHATLGGGEFIVVRYM